MYYQINQKQPCYGHIDKQNKFNYPQSFLLVQYPWQPPRISLKIIALVENKESEHTSFYRSKRKEKISL